MSKNLELSKETDSASGLARSSASFFSGPIPPASEFAKYESVLKGSADRILKMSESQSKHRRFVEKVVVIFDSLKSLGGVVSALVVVLGGIAGGVYLIIQDKPVGGYVAIIAPLGVIAGTFLLKEKATAQDSEKSVE